MSHTEYIEAALHADENILSKFSFPVAPPSCGRMSLTEVVFPALAEWVHTMGTAVLMDASFQPEQLYMVALM